MGPKNRAIMENDGGMQLMQGQEREPVQRLLFQFAVWKSNDACRLGVLYY